MSKHDARRTDRVRYGTIDHEYGLKLATTEPGDDGPVWMINLMKYREVAEYGDGSAGISGREADDRYMPVESQRLAQKLCSSPMSKMCFWVTG